MRFFSFLLLSALLITIALSAECPPRYKKICSSADPKNCNPKCYKVPLTAADAMEPLLELCPAGKDWTCQAGSKGCVCA